MDITPLGCWPTTMAISMERPQNGGGTATACTGFAIGCGTVFKLDPRSGNETVLYRFKGGIDGGGPQAGVIYHDGTTVQGGLTHCPGPATCGTIFRVDAATGSQTTLYRFTGGIGGET